MSVKTVKVTDDVLIRQIERGAKVNAKIKVLTAELKGIKEDLSKLEPNKYLTDDGNAVTISEAPRFSDVSPELAKKALRGKRLGNNFMDCVKVAITPLKRYLSDQEIGTLRETVGYTRKYSFK